MQGKKEILYHLILTEEEAEKLCFILCGKPSIYEPQNDGKSHDFFPDLRRQICLHLPHRA